MYSGLTLSSVPSLTIFSKWISSIGAYVGEYKVYKNICSTKAGEELTKFIKRSYEMIK